ncbi:MAG: cache domain-containing protein [Candidatus Omnitrophica bacterium]|nr:cache domain-containing protein [Candidatus Omnitrophota bacterium]
MPFLGWRWPVIPLWFLRLYRHPVLFLTTVLVVPIVAMALWLIVVNERQWRHREAEDLLVASRLAGRILREELTQTLEAEQAIVSQPTFREAVRRGDRQLLAASLRLLAEAMPMVDDVSVLDARGRPLASIPEDSRESRPVAAVEASDPSAFAGAPSISGVYLRSRASGDKVITVSTPITNHDTPIGMLQMQYRLSAVSQWVDKVRIEPSGFLYIVDQYGLLVAYPFQVLPGSPKNVSAWPPVAAETSAEGRLIRFRHGQPARRWTAAATTIEPFGWRVIAQQSDAVMLRPFYELVGSFAVLLLVLMAVISALVLRWARLHEATLALLAKQAHLLRVSERRRVEDVMRHKKSGASP